MFKEWGNIHVFNTYTVLPNNWHENLPVRCDGCFFINTSTYELSHGNVNRLNAPFVFRHLSSNLPALHLWMAFFFVYLISWFLHFSITVPPALALVRSVFSVVCPCISLDWSLYFCGWSLFSMIGACVFLLAGPFVFGSWSLCLLWLVHVFSVIGPCIFCS